MTNCINCHNPVGENYCPKCGQPARLKRIDGHYIIHEIEHILHVEKGILYTVRELTINPGENVKQFISENRSRLVKPVVFIIITSLIYTLVTHFFHVEDGYVKLSETEKSTIGSIFKWVQAHYGYANIIIGMFVAFWLKLFFRKSDYNFYEILLLLCFVIGMQMLLFSVFAFLQGLTHFELMQFASFVGLIYCTWAIGQFFNKKKPISYVKAFASYMFGMITFVLSILLVGSLVDLM